MTSIYLAIAATFFVAINGMEIKSRIAGGTSVSIDSYPYMVSIVAPGNIPYCSGSIISENVILTAAHCIGETFNTIVIRAGSTYNKKGGIDYPVDKFIIHDYYKLFTVTINDHVGHYTINDIALVKVKGSFNFGKSIKPIPLLDAYEEIKSNSYGVVSGWGKVPEEQKKLWPEEYKEFNRLQSVVVPIYNKSFCENERAVMNRTLTAGQICAGGITGTGACMGDSGGPLVVDGRLAGIVSYGHGCGVLGTFSTVYTKVSNYRNWIDDTLEILKGFTENEDGVEYFEGAPIWG